jgi:hypothetical protein
LSGSNTICKLAEYGVRLLIHMNDRKLIDLNDRWYCNIAMI